MRKLATIQIVNKITKHQNADTLDIIEVLGWKCIAKTGQFHIGEKCVYVEIDSILPDKPEFAFLKNRGFRIKTIRLRGQVSQGICFPLSILNETYTEKDVGTDVTDILGIKKYEPYIPACLRGTVKGSFPSFIPKTDETRVQVLQDVLTRYKGIACYITEKIDGSSVTYYLKDGIFGVCSRNLELIETEDNAYWKMARKLDIENKLRTYGKNIAIQGELFGSGLNGNNLKQSELKVMFFNVFDINGYKYYNYPVIVSILTELGLDMVPTLSTSFLLDDNIDNLVKISIDKSKINPDVMREGIVIRPLIELMDMQMATGFGNGRISFKVINPEYLLENE